MSIETTLSNRKRRIARHLRSFPNDDTAVEQLRIMCGGKLPHANLEANRKGRKVWQRHSDRRWGRL
jgi:hypothetical protein